MMDLVPYNHATLHEPCQSIDKIDDKIRSLARQLTCKMIEENGIGLAANQTGYPLRLIIVQLSSGTQALVNPKIIDMSSETIVSTEGCLSFPGQLVDVRRAKLVRVEAQNLMGETIQIQSRTILDSVVLQHEIDHINGITMLDRSQKK